MFKLILIIIIIFSNIAYSAINPTRLDDARIQIVNFNPRNVVNVRCQIGQATMIEFEKGEEIIEYAFGDTEAWHFNKKNNIIIIKPKAVKPDTNLLIKTNKRTYSFDLSTLNKMPLTYYLKFTYESKNNNVKYIDVKNDYIYKSRGKWLNYNYWGRGAKELAPLSMYDDGLFTSIDFRNLSDLPTVYKIMPDGTEAMVQFHMENGIMIIHELMKEIYVRFGKKVLGIKNKNFEMNFNTNKYNDFGTSKKATKTRKLNK